MWLIPSYRPRQPNRRHRHVGGDALTVSKPNSTYKAADAVSAMYYMRRSKG